MVFIELLGALADFAELIGWGLNGLLGRRPSGAEKLRAAADIVAGVFVLFLAAVAFVAAVLAIFHR
jgi:hypothetical protein